MPGIFDLLTPIDNNDGYAITDPQYQLGGFREVATLIERDAIPLGRKRNGMFVYVLEDDKIYKLINGTWQEFIINNSPTLLSNINQEIGTLTSIDSGINSILKIKNANTISGVCSRKDGDLLFIYNISNNDIIVKNLCHNTDEDKQIITGINQDLFLKSFSAILISYDIVLQKWKVLFYDRDIKEFNKDIFSYSIYSFGDINQDKSIDLSNIDFGGGVLYHSNNTISRIKLENGIIGKTYKIFTVSNGVQFEFYSNNKVIWKDNIKPIISLNTNIDIFYFECIAIDTFLGYCSSNYSYNEIITNQIYSPVEPTIWGAV
jgi:hypothetical protein